MQHTRPGVCLRVAKKKRRTGDQCGGLRERAFARAISMRYIDYVYGGKNMMVNQFIEIIVRRCGGKPVVAGARIPVTVILD